MSQTPLNQTNQFGIDDYVPFFGQIEDVDDPKRSGRVRVRCIGWHPKYECDLYRRYLQRTSKHWGCKCNRKQPLQFMGYRPT